MSLAIIYTRAIIGIKAPLVTVEAHLSNGMPKFSIVGLPETIIKESKDRIRSAIINSHFTFPNHRITVNLAPADLPKMGSRFDLPIALAILAASKQIPSENLLNYEFVGELALSGATRPISSILSLVLALKLEQSALKKPNSRALILPADNAKEAAYVKDITLYPATHLLDICQHLKGEHALKTHCTPREEKPLDAINYPFDLSDVLGQTHAKRALTIAAAGRHSVLLSGPPGCGKSMLAKRLISILPDMTDIESLEVAAIRSIAKNPPPSIKANRLTRPYRSPHHTISSAALVGGGNPPQPGEISYAHHGLLFLDELPEFNRKTLESLREPLEQKKITIARAAHTIELPAQFQLVADMKLCPCGHYGDLNQPCYCPPGRVRNYLQRLSGPLLERIDLHLSLNAVSLEHFNTLKKDTHLDSATLRKKVQKAHQYQLQQAGKPYGDLTEKEINQHDVLTSKNRQYLVNNIKKLGLSARSYHRVLKLALTIASLRNSYTMNTDDLMEALSYQTSAVHQYLKHHLK